MSSPPVSLGQYEIIREIARSNDIVYEAFDPVMHRRVAVKELNLPAGMTTTQSEERARRFRREAQAAGTLNHRNIMTVFALAEDQGRIFMALEFLDGETLRALVDREAPLPAARAVELVNEVLAGLGHAHANHVIHRDIKPDNVQILSDGVVKITDFGIARLKTQENLTIDGQVFGTPSYMSPEQIRGQDLDHRSDLFSVGVMLYEMLAGSKPFTGDSVIAITHAILNSPPVPPPGISGGLWNVLLRSMDKTPSGRYQSASEMARALDDAVRGPVTAVPPTPPPIATPASVVYDPYAGAVGSSVPPPSPYLYTQAAYVPHAGPSMPAPPLPPPGFVYPTPPKKPLLSQEQSEFFKRLFMTILIVGTFIFLLVIAMRSLTEYFGERTARTSKPRPIGTPASRVREYEKWQKTAPTPAAREVVAEDKAAALVAQGDEAYRRGDTVSAEQFYIRATEEDATSPVGWTRYGDLLAEQATSQAEGRGRAMFYKEASEAWLRAAEQTADEATRNDLRAKAAQAGYAFAEHVKQIGDVTQYPAARESARITITYAAPGSPLYREATDLLAELNR